MVLREEETAVEDFVVKLFSLNGIHSLVTEI